MSLYGLIPDSPTRVGAPDGGPSRPDFDSLPMAERLDAAERLTRRQFYREALAEAFGQHERSESFFALLTDSASTDEAVGQLAREIGLDYLKRCAERRDEDIRDFV